jgi:hypothetical protein
MTLTYVHNNDYFYFCAIEAFIKCLNKGWLLVGLDLNSGWNCDATNQG